MPARRSLLLVLITGLLASACTGSGAPPPIPVDTTPAADAVTGGDASHDTVTGMADASFAGCDPYIGALVDCPYQWLLPEGGCPRAPCLPAPCAVDDDCPGVPGDGAGERCVFGNCVWCWDDADCDTGRSCRAGRCIARADPVCPAPPSCDGVGCGLVSISEVPCPVCLCEETLSDACQTEQDCFEASPYLYTHCVYGRCGLCRNDGDCHGLRCLPPGLCKDVAIHPAALYGTWLVGWPGGLNHYSLFRFEPDGTLRRGPLPEDPIWADDIPPFPCDPGADGQWPVLGIWEPVAEGALRIRLTSGVPCDGVAWSEEFRVLVADDEDHLTFISPGGAGQTLDAMRVAADVCDPSFASCSIPESW
jgi:hypothetical protein